MPWMRNDKGGFVVLHGDFEKAFQFNKAVFIIFPLIVALYFKWLIKLLQKICNPK
jgi:hypothetical protein